MKKSTLLFLLLSHVLFAQNSVSKWQPFTLDLPGPSLSETSAENPFTDYRLDVTFTKGGRSLVVPGYFAADGKAAESGAVAGNVWRTKFTPDEEGTWNYKVSFKKGKHIAVSDDPYEGEAVRPIDGKTGSLNVTAPAASGSIFLTKGRLQYGGGHYFRHQNGEYFLKGGTNSPENFLAYKDIDGTYSYDPDKNFLKTWQPHAKDWQTGDPSWQNGKGKGIVGALNYLADKGMSSVYALTLNIEGDARDVWPFLSHERKDYLRYDVSKLAQWDVIFSHAERKGVAMQLVTQEKENELLLDDGDTGLLRKLYYRELIARFGHHNNIIWNMGEENGQVPFWPQGQSDQQRFAMIRYLKDHDPYKHPLVIHTMPGPKERDHIIDHLYGFDRLDGLSLQESDKYRVHDQIVKILKKSREKKRPWIVTMDEIGRFDTGTMRDLNDPKHDTLRQEVLWGALMAGAGGVEWYYGWVQPPHDLNAEDFRSRNNMYEQTDKALKFFRAMPFHEMTSSDELIDTKEGYCFSKAGEAYAVYLKKGGSATLNLKDAAGTFSVKWYHPVNGTWHGESTVRGGGGVTLKSPADVPSLDWAVLLEKK